jgi:hypothetical protein
MRIFLVTAPSGIHGVGGLQTWERNFLHPMRNLGHEVFYLDTDALVLRLGSGPKSKKYREIVSNQLLPIFLKEHREKPFDLFFSYLYNKRVDPEVFGEITKHVFTVNFSTNFNQFPLYRDIAEKVHLNIYITKKAGPAFDALKVASYWMPLASNPQENLTNAPTGIPEVSFVGSAYGSRPYYMWRILQQGLPLEIFGYFWRDTHPAITFMKKGRDFLKFVTSRGNSRLDALETMTRRQILGILKSEFPHAIHPPIPEDAYFQILHNSKINLNLSESRFDYKISNPDVIYGTNLRDFEVTVNGGFLLTQHSEELPEMFAVDEEVVTFKNEPELLDKLRFYLDHPASRERIREAGTRRAQKEHTWENRFRQFFAHLGKGTG